MVGTGPEHLLQEAQFPTTGPCETLERVNEFFQPYKEQGALAAVGIASFGPLDLNTNSPTYGSITTTPKAGWSQVDICGEIRRSLDVPVALDTDVNAAAFGEQYWFSENKGLDPFLYITVGTGIGVGAVINGAPLHGLMHGEAGHLSLPHDWGRDPFPGVCPYHGDCLEGLASGSALRERWGQSPEQLTDPHPAWDLEAEYLGLALANLIYAYSPRRIVLGGGVFQHPGLLAKARCQAQKSMNGYIQAHMIAEKIDEYIVPPALGKRSGGLGAIAMAMEIGC
jgi:fructokinase